MVGRGEGASTPSARLGSGTLPHRLLAFVHTPEGDALRLELRLVRGLGAEAGRVAAAMGMGEPPATVEELCRAAGLN